MERVPIKKQTNFDDLDFHKRLFFFKKWPLIIFVFLFFLDHIYTLIVQNFIIVISKNYKIEVVLLTKPTHNKLSQIFLCWGYE